MNQHTQRPTTATANALTALRATFEPITGRTQSHKQASLPRFSRVHATPAAQGGGWDLHAWVDAAPGALPDYVRENAPAFEVIMGGGSDA